MTAVVIFTGAAVATADRIAAATGGTVHACGRNGRDAGTLLPALFAEGTVIVGVCAAGILIRHLAPHLGDKQAEPPVIAVSADGAHVVPLLGGHRGANALAREIATALGGTAAVTTASDARFGRALDEPPEGWVLADPAAAKRAMSAALDGTSIRLEGMMPWLAVAGYPLVQSSSVAFRDGEPVSAAPGNAPDGAVRVTVGVGPPPGDTLHYFEKSLVAGVGCERGTDPGEVIGLIAATLREAGLAREALAAIATIELKADEAALTAATAHFGVPLRLFSADELAAEADRLPNPSEVVRRETGTPGVAEAAALKAGTLLVDKRKSTRATCAIGRAPGPVDVENFGRPRGELHLVGVGPGEADQRTASAVVALRHATDWVGYSLYLDLVTDLSGGQIEHRYGLGEEEARTRHALELAGTGRRVALVCSGDAQIFAMAALVFELLEAEGERGLSDPARRVAVTSHPGITALQMASARAGALIGHDFCAVSLSDLLTPREHILRRLDAAARGDFVTALYNPRSGRRTELIEIARDIFADHRPPSTPVVVARSLGRPDETVTVTTLEDFDVETVDMMTLVLVGSSHSRAFARGDGRTVAFTPRGYARKGGGT